MIESLLISWLITGAITTAWWLVERGIPYRGYYGLSVILQALVVFTLTGPIYMVWAAQQQPTEGSGDD